MSENAKKQALLDEFPDEEFLLADGFDDAIIGVDHYSRRVVYSVWKCLEILEKSMSPEDAQDYFSFNVAGAYVGEKTPIFVEELPTIE